MLRSRPKLVGATAVGLLVLAGIYGLWAARHGTRVPASRPVGYHRPGPGLNLLALEASPYLQLHAHNPVDWYPWGEEAFERARAEDKLVFVSIGYSTCYWCHVMEREIFSDQQIAAVMNAHFISIKVDREERPDIDDVYLRATQLLTGSGGWPNSVFLTPDGKPFYAGTYFPPEDRNGQPGFPRVLRGLYQSWINDREKVLATAGQVTQRLGQLANSQTLSSRPPPPAGETMGRALGQLRDGFDAEYGGFGRGTKFPEPPILELILSHLEQERDPEIETMLVRTLDAMALGGIYDHLADGFHRYSTERTWSVPHFEKMLYDNAQLVGVYARAYTLTGNPLYRRTVERTVSYLDREMSHPDGGYYSAQDAEVAGVEGASYLWSRAGIERVLGPRRARTFLAVYQLTPTRENPEVGVLRVRLPLAELLKKTGARDAAALLARFDDERSALLAQRATRPQPLRDDKVISAWNGLAIRGLVEAAQALGRPEYLHRAERAANFVLARLLTKDGTLRRSYIAGQAREDGVLDDYAFLADGLLALHEATGDPRWRTAARRLADIMLARFEDSLGGGFFLTPAGSKLLLRPKPFEDNVVPSGNGVALRVLRTLAAGGRSERYSRAARSTAAAAGALLRRAPQALPTTVAVLASSSGPETAGAVRPRPESPAERSQADSATVFHIPTSEDHVHTRLVRSGTGNPAGFMVRMSIDEGWHVNANPASLPFLIATAVEVVGGSGSAIVRYPGGQSFRPEFAAEAIQVYQGRVDIPVALGEDAGSPVRLAVRFQACDASRCLPPHRAVLTVEPAAPAGP